MQNAGALTHGNGGLIGQAAVIPLAVSEIGDIAHVGLDVAKSQIAPVNIFSFHCKHLSEIFIFPILAPQAAQVKHLARKKVSHTGTFVFFRGTYKNRPFFPPFSCEKLQKGLVFNMVKW